VASVVFAYGGRWNDPGSRGTSGREAYVTDAHKALFVYGWGYCDTSSRIAEAAWKEYKKDPRAAERVCVQHDDGGYHTITGYFWTGAMRLSISARLLPDRP